MANVGMLQAIRMLEYGFEDPIWLRMGGYQTRAQIAELWSDVFGYPLDSATKALEKDLGFEHIVPNSYWVYWSYGPSALVERLQREYHVFLDGISDNGRLFVSTKPLRKLSSWRASFKQKRNSRTNLVAWRDCT